MPESVENIITANYESILSKNVPINKGPETLLGGAGAKKSAKTTLFKLTHDTTLEKL